jgi:CubicO group peptidase (beta-lactamase class C family)
VPSATTFARPYRTQTHGSLSLPSSELLGYYRASLRDEQARVDLCVTRPDGSRLTMPCSFVEQRIYLMTTSVFCRAALSVMFVAGIFIAADVSGDEASSAPVGRMAAALRHFVESQTLAGAVVLVADKNRVLDIEAVGYADVAAKKPMQTDSVFWVASQSKPIATTALMMLVDEGKLKLDDPVEKYLPEFKGQMVVVERDDEHVLLRKPKHPITIRNVLSHTSGLPFSSPIETPTLDLFPLEYRVRSYAMLPLQFEPDTGYNYANAGINTAARIIEVASGMPFAKYLDERIFKPLGMKDTSFWPTGDQLRRLAKSYKPASGGLEECPITQLKYPLDDPQRQPMPAGGLFSTAADLCLFYRMIANKGELAGKRIVSAPAIAEMASRQLSSANYGLGMVTDEDHIGHGGAYSTDSRIAKKHGLILIFLVQHAGWPEGGDNILGIFHKAALDAFAPQSP